MMGAKSYLFLRLVLTITNIMFHVINLFYTFIIIQVFPGINNKSNETNGNFYIKVPCKIVPLQLLAMAQTQRVKVLFLEGMSHGSKSNNIGEPWLKG